MRHVIHACALVAYINLQMIVCNIFTERGHDCRYPKVALWREDSLEGSLAQENEFVKMLFPTQP